jgi:hypothetical protein
LPPNQAIEFYGRASRQTKELFNEWNGGFEIGGRRVSMSLDDNYLTITADGNGRAIPLCMDDLTPLQGDFANFTVQHIHAIASWENLSYDGPATMTGRRAQRYAASAPPSYGNAVAAVKIGIDDAYGCPLSWEAVDGDGHVVRRFRIRSIKKDSYGDWCASSCEFYMPREKTTLHIKFVDEDIFFSAMRQPKWIFQRNQRNARVP